MQQGNQRKHWKTDLDRLNNLIDWYNRYGKQTAGRVIQVRLSEMELDRIAKRIAGQPNRWRYRERVLERQAFEPT